MTAVSGRVEGHLWLRFRGKNGATGFQDVNGVSEGRWGREEGGGGGKSEEEEGGRSEGLTWQIFLSLASDTTATSLGAHT
jgi:hypothetical protein